MSTFGLRPGRSADAQEQIFQATTLIGFAGEPPVFFGTCFFVAHVPEFTPYATDDTAVMFLVTARHVVAQALHDGRQLCIRLNRFAADPTNLILPNTGWRFSTSGADVAILALPDLKAERTSGGIASAVISHRQFYIEDWRISPHEVRLGDTVRIVGMWYGNTAYPQLIMRSGNIASATIGAVQFASGALPAYLADVSVTRAMSGGPVYATSGRGWAETVLIGINHGYWPVDLAELDDVGVRADESEPADDRARRYIMAQIERLNSRLAIVTPVHHLAELLLTDPLWSR